MRKNKGKTMLTCKRDILCRHLHNSVIVTQSIAMKKLVDLSMTIGYAAARPFSVYVATPPQAVDKLGLPVSVSDTDLYQFMERNVNDTQLDIVDINALPRVPA